MQTTQKETGLQPLDTLLMQSINGGSITPPGGTDVHPVTFVPGDWYHRTPWLLRSGAGEHAA